MAPKAPAYSLLFHPKKGKKAETPASSPSPRKPQPGAAPRPKPKPLPAEPEEEDVQLPEGTFQEFKLMSSALNGWKYDVMRFDSRKLIEISRWQAPIKLNRKELKYDGETEAAPVPVKPMLGHDGKPVIGPDGKMVMLTSEGRAIHTGDGASGSSNGPKAQGPPGKKRFQKKTRQVYFVAEETRQLRREERYPWIMEDSSKDHDEVWVGKLDDATKAETLAFFMPAANDVFKFVPAHRWYKFQKKIKHDLPTDSAQVEAMFNSKQKRDLTGWLSARTGKAPSEATAATLQANAEGRSIGGGLVHSSGQSLGPGGRKLKAVDSGASGAFDDDDDVDSKRRREKEQGGEGDLDEQLFEEDFADDEEQMDIDENDEEAKELEERMKREYKAANKHREAGVDESDEEEIPGISKQAKAMQKLIRNREGNDIYDSDEEENPYASSAEEEEEEEPEAATGPAVQPQPQQVPASQTASQSTVPRPQSGTGSRATSPVASPSLGGHSIVAKRATSPKPPKVKNINGGNSPLGSRAASPVGGSRATSPVAGNRAESPPAGNKKRKAAEEYGGPMVNGANGIGNGQAPKPKKRKPDVTPVETEQLRAMLIEWLDGTSNATTRECIQHFSPWIKEEPKKKEFSALVREVAMLKGGVLVLRKKLQGGGSAAPSPSPVAN